MNVKVGAKMLKIMAPSNTSEAWVAEAEVTNVDEDVITCTVYMDVPRTMKFKRKNGVMIDDDSQFIIRKP